MFEVIKEAREALARALASIGINPLYLVTGLLMLLVLLHWKSYAKWSEQSDEQKKWLINWLAGAILLLVICIIQLLVTSVDGG